MSKEPTQEQRDAAESICDWRSDGYKAAYPDDIERLLVERDEAREAVIRQFRSVVHQLLIIEEPAYPIMDRVLRDEARQAMLASAQYEVSE